MADSSHHHSEHANGVSDYLRHDDRLGRLETEVFFGEGSKESIRAILKSMDQRMGRLERGRVVQWVIAIGVIVAAIALTAIAIKTLWPGG